MTGEPILIPCEGSGGTGNLLLINGQGEGDFVNVGCAMCGAMFLAVGDPAKFGDIRVPEHTRDDILARIDRGDFG